MAKTVKTIGAAPAGGMAWTWTCALGIARRFGRLCSTYIIGEHRCYPPADGRHWVPVPSSVTSADGGYVCPECEQRFVPEAELTGENAGTSKG